MSENNPPFSVFYNVIHGCLSVFKNQIWIVRIKRDPNKDLRITSYERLEDKG